MIKKLNILVLSVALILTVVLNSNCIFAKGNYDLNIPIDENNINGNFTSSYNYAKAFYQNDADTQATVYIQSVDGEKIYDSFSVDANSPKRSDKTMNLSEGTKYSYKIVMSNEDISPAGTFIVKSASTFNELE